MSILATPALMTAEQLLAMPDDGVERFLINGQLRGGGMTRRNRRHSRSMALISHLLESWLKKQPSPRGEIATGDVGILLRREPDTSVGVDVAYLSAELAASTPDDASIIEGIPTLAVEILSPSDTHEDVRDKTQSNLELGVPLVWVADPDFQTVTVYSPDAEPVLFNRKQELTGDPQLPGFRCLVADFFKS